MKQTIQKITIMNPCQENWHHMAASGDGRFCDCCKKDVIDFTGLSDEEILKYLSGVDNLCGRFDVDRLTQLNMALQRKPLLAWRKFGIAAAFLGVLPIIRANANTPVKTEQSPRDNRKPAEPVSSSVTISGKIIGADDCYPVAGVSVKAKGTSIIAISDVNGNYKLKVPRGIDTLEFSFIGYETQDIKIDRLNLQPVNILLVLGPPIYSEVVVGGAIIQHSFVHRVWRKITWPVRSIFRHH
jgi:hypothetical protein